MASCCGPMSSVRSEVVAGPETLLPEALMRNRSDIVKRALEHPLDDQYHRDRRSLGLLSMSPARFLGVAYASRQ